MKSLTGLLTALRLAEWAAPARGADAPLPTTAKPCAPGTFEFPAELEGAVLVGVEAAEVRGLEFAPLTPEGRAAIPASGGVGFCNVTVSYAHAGFDDTTRVQVWLPAAEAWNERFVGVGGGGYSAGQFGSEKVVATVAQGYAGMFHPFPFLRVAFFSRPFLPLSWSPQVPTRGRVFPT